MGWKTSLSLRSWPWRETGKKMQARGLFSISLSFIRLDGARDTLLFMLYPRQNVCIADVRALLSNATHADAVCIEFGGLCCSLNRFAIWPDFVPRSGSVVIPGGVVMTLLLQLELGE